MSTLEMHAASEAIAGATRVEATRLGLIEEEHGDRESRS